MEVFHAEYELLFGFSNFGTIDNPFGNRPFSKSFKISRNYFFLVVIFVISLLPNLSYEIYSS